MEITPEQNPVQDAAGGNRPQQHRRGAVRHLFLSAGWLTIAARPELPSALRAASGFVCTVHLASAAIEYLLLRVTAPRWGAVVTVAGVTARASEE
jgi:hypothetical protein